MPLPPLLRHIYNHGTEEVIRRGKKIYLTSGVSLLDADHLIGQIRFRVRNDQYHNFYVVTVDHYAQPQKLSLRCQCPYNMGEICRHEVAALFQLNDLMQTGFFEHQDPSHDQRHTIIRLRAVNEHTLLIYSSEEIKAEADQLVRDARVEITRQVNEHIEASVTEGGQVYKVQLRQNEEKYFDTSCTCSETGVALCKHKYAVFLQTLRQHGPQYFQASRNFDEQKNKLLSLYGYSLQDDLTGKFTFTYEQGKPFLRVLDPTIRRLGMGETRREEDSETATLPEPDQRLIALVLDNRMRLYPHLQVTLIAGQPDDDGYFLPGFDTLDLNLPATHFNESQRETLSFIKKFTPEELGKYLKKNLPFGDFVDSFQEILTDHPPEETRERVWEYLIPKFRKLCERFAGYPYTYLLENGKSLHHKALRKIEFDPAPFSLHGAVSKQKTKYQISWSWEGPEGNLPWSEATLLCPGLVLHAGVVHPLELPEEAMIADRVPPDGLMLVKSGEWKQFLDKTLFEWSSSVQVTFSEELQELQPDTEPRLRLYLQERDQSLVLRPRFVYHDAEIVWGNHGDVMIPYKGKVRIIRRNDLAERNWIAVVAGLHENIQLSQEGHFFYLHAQQVLSNNWFYRFNQELKERGIELYGLEGLKHLRINPHRPETKMQISNGIDWFDTSVEIHYGKQVATITDIRQALSQKQHFIRLADGTLGLLPEDWIRKYALLLKMGDTKGTKVRLKKVHFSILDELLQHVDQQSLQNELEEKKGRLEGIIENDFQPQPLPGNLQATLRPYQQSGFQWLHFLHESGWGGILADDMGLGKTVQTLAFFQDYKNRHPEARFLVVCPTTLMYNWQAEIGKFTPTLSHFIHHGPKRAQIIEALDGADVLITTYGTMRSDIKFLREIVFDYIVLDESQAIKNPQSQVAKSSLLLQGRNRLALSGTPIQNNTFDLYSQMNFLNPGMLGSREFFANEFATPIDKFQESEVKHQLKKLIYPFLLRRTKEQVAKDLPEKTETVLYCEMGPEQRKIYDLYRSSFRNELLGIIDQKGIDKAQFHILQGLTKLRQICDSPAIMNEPEKHENHSVKLNELMREISENIGNHKALVFSQFLGMLDLIRRHLDAEKIDYAYFDGSSTTREREQAIHKFQNTEGCRVFLISLKAGGIGLNLTAADYVYIVDPWWNPAVEQQAIDRTHRIGQTKNIFAYRLICKDSVEEKMMQLQERKRSLAGELISDDDAMVKRLTREDIVFLLG